MSTFSISRPKFSFSDIKMLALLEFSQHVYGSLNGNTHFASLASKLPLLDAAIISYNDAIQAAVNKDKLKVADRNSKRLLLEAVLRDLAAGVLAISKDRNVLLTSGFEIITGRNPVEPVGPPEGLKYSYLPGVSGSIKLRWSRASVRDAGAFLAEVTTGNPNDPASTWEIKGSSKKCSMILTDLTPGVTYSIRIYGIGALGPGGKSAPISVMCI